MWSPRVTGSCTPQGLRRRDVPIDRNGARQHARIAAHVRRTLHVVLAAQRIDTGSRLADVARQQREVDECRHAVGALDVLGEAKTMDAHGGRAGGVRLRPLA